MPNELIAGNGIWSYALGQVDIVRFDNREVVLTGKLVHGMPCVVLDDLWHLPCRTSEASILSDGIDIDELEL